MISNVSGFNNLYGYQSIMNQYRLNNALMNRYPGASAISPVPAIPGLGSNSGALTDSIAYLKNYTSSMTDLMSSANSLRGGNTGSVMNQLEATSSDTSILTASKAMTMSPKDSYQVQVDQLAQNQINVSDAVASNQRPGTDLSMKLNGPTGALDVQVSSTDKNGLQKTNSQMLSEAAAAINKGNTGVKASVITKDGQSSLQLASVKTGTGNQFSVSGSFAENGGMANTTQAAENASYSVTKNGFTQNYTSQSNDVTLDYGKINATLKSTGSASIKAGTDNGKITSAMEDFVKSYNDTVSLLSKNQNRGSATTRQLQTLKGYVLGSEQGRKQLGLSFNKDGTLALDKEQLTKSLETDPENTKQLISGSSGLAQRAFSVAQSATNVSVGSLLGNDLASFQYSQATNNITFMNSFNRSGAYNMNNYNVVGLLMNTFV